MKKLLIIAGPCAIEDEKTPLLVAEKMLGHSEKLGFDYVFKGSVKKANRTKLTSFTGIDESKALNILQKVKDNFGVQVLTDIHEPKDAAKYAEVADILQIPAFLCRQTDLLLAAGKTGKSVNVKKGQFSSPESMKFALEKIRSTGNQRILLTERGTFFGYNDLVVDFRGIADMKKLQVPVILDCTHSLQKPNQTEGVTGGSPGYIELIAKAGVAAGVDGLFLEVHPNPENAKSDGANMLQLDKADSVLNKCLQIYRALQENA